MKCGDCWYCKENYCSKWKSVVSKETMVTDCKSYTETKPSNKGLEIRSKKLNKQREKRNVVKEQQQGVCQFVSVSWKVIERVNGKYQCTGTQKGNGLQIENKVFLTNGHYKLINNKNFKIEKTYSNIPDWVTQELKDRYYKFMSK